MNCGTCGVQTARTLIDGLLLTVDVATYREHACPAVDLSRDWDAPVDRPPFECLCGGVVVQDHEGVRRDWPTLAAHKPHSAPKVASKPQSHATERKAVASRSRGIEM